MPSTEVRIPDDITDAEWAYLAGLVDGEGTIGVHGRSLTVRLAIRMCDEGVVQWLASRFAGTVRTTIPSNPNHSQSWCWDLSRQADLLCVLDCIVPYLRVKKTHAYEAIHFLYLCQVDKLKPKDPRRIRALKDIRALNRPRNHKQGVRPLP